MKFLNTFLSLLAIPVLVSPVLAENTPGALAGYLPSDGSLKQGASVRAVLDSSLEPFANMIRDNLSKLSEEKRNELLKDYNSDNAFPYDEAIFGDKETYNKYMEAWKKTRFVPTGSVAIGLLATGTKDQWQVYSVTKDAAGRALPLTISSLRYDAARNVWISPNGELTPTPFSADENFVFGAQSGTEWSVERSNRLAVCRETVRITKSTNGNAVFIYYFFIEKSTYSGGGVAQSQYVLWLPTITESAGLSQPGQK